MVHKDLEFLLVAENCDLRILTDYLTMRNNGNIRLTQKFPHSLVNSDAYRMYITIEKYTRFQLKSILVLIVCEDKKII